MTTPATPSPTALLSPIALLSPTALRERMQTDDLLVLQVTAPQVYAQAHLPGAVPVTPAELIRGEPPAVGKLPRRDALVALFRRVGLTRDRTVVACDDEGGGWAGRLAWTLDVIGHHDWCYLDGGLHAWAAAGLPFSDAPVAVTPSDIDFDIHLGPVIDLEDLRAALDAPDTLVWDCRSPEEYAGLKRTAARNGHIPGAINLDWLELMDRARGLALVEDLENRLAERGITRDRDIITHCQTHHRSGLTYMAARLLGFPRIRAYDGSWSEWGNRTDTPIER